MAQKDIVGNEIDLRHQDREADRQGHAKDIPVANGDSVSFGTRAHGGKKEPNLH
jgi:hypothetical protein